MLCCVVYCIVVYRIVLCIVLYRIVLCIVLCCIMLCSEWLCSVFRVESGRHCITVLFLNSISSCEKAAAEIGCDRIFIYRIVST